jgi:hypothetical protein
MFLVKIIKNFLTNQKGKYNHHKTEDPFPIPAGCPQGSLLSPCPRNVIIYDIVRLPSDHSFQAGLYHTPMINQLQNSKKRGNHYNTLASFYLADLYPEEQPTTKHLTISQRDLSKITLLV